MFSFGGSELLIVVVLALLLFGPDKIPQFARTIGRFMREFNKYKDMMESTFRTEIYKAEREDPAAPSGSTASVENLTTEERIARAAAAANVVKARREADAKAAEEAANATPREASAEADEAAARDALTQPETLDAGTPVTGPPVAALSNEGDKEVGN